MLTDTDTWYSLHKFNLEEDKRLRKAFVRPALEQIILELNRWGRAFFEKALYAARIFPKP